MEICRENAGPVFQGKHFVRACAVKMHMDMSQEAFCVMSPTHYYHNFSVDANVGQIRQHVGENGPLFNGISLPSGCKSSCTAGPRI